MGLYLRGKNYWFRIRYKGKKIQKSLKTRNQKLAVKRYGKILAEIEEGNYSEKPKNITMNEIFDQFIDEVTPGYTITSKNRYLQVIKNYRAGFGDLNIQDVTPSVLSKYKAKRLKRVQHATVKKELWCLSKIFNVAIDEWEIVSFNPVKKVIKHLRSENKRVRYLEDGEEQSLFLALPHWLKPIVTVALQTGLRRGNIIALTPTQVDFKLNCIVVPRTKNDEPVTVPMTNRVRNTLMEVISKRKKKSKYVFCDENGYPYSGGQVHAAFKRACKRAGIENLRFHDLRHEFATSLVRAGVDLYRVSKLCGHKDQRMTQRYAHLITEDLKKAIKAIDTDECGTFCGTF